MKPEVEPLIDAHGRTISDLRVSVTDRCNFRCQYCMPADGLPWLERDEVLSFEEIERLVSLLVRLGIEDVRLTGGEPLVRKEFPRLVAMLAPIEGLRDLSMTTNGYLLERDAGALVEAGIGRVNVSIDSLARDRFFQITRRDALPQVLRGLEAIAAHEGSARSRSTRSRCATSPSARSARFAELARLSEYQVRFIEFMPLDADGAWTPDSVLTGAEIRALIEREHELVEVPREPSATARVFRFADGAGRDRLHQPGQRALLRRLQPPPPHRRGQAPHLPLLDPRDRPPRAASRGASDAELEEIIRDAVWRKELKHHVGEPGFRPPPRSMSAIGG